MEEICGVKGCFKIYYNLSLSNASDIQITFIPITLPVMFKIVFILLHILLTLVSLGGNCFLCYTVWRSMRRNNSRNEYFLVSSAVSDILMSTVCAPFEVISELVFNWWPYGSIFCPCLKFLQMTFVVQKSLNMVVISYDQYHAVAHPLSRLSITKKRLLTTTSWLISLVVAIPAAARSMHVTFVPNNKGHCLEVWNNRLERTVYSFAVMLAQFAIPVVFIIVLYVHIGHIIWTAKTPGEQDHRRDKKIAKSKRKGLRMLILLVVTFCLTWLPLHVTTIFDDIYPTMFNNKSGRMLFIAFQWLALSNTGTNCIIYFWKNNILQSVLKRTLARVTCNQMFNMIQTT